GDGRWDESQGEDQPSALEARVDDERDDQAERELERDRDERELDRHPDRVAEERVVPEVAVVLQADPFRRRERQELLVGEALVDRLPQRVHRHERHDDERGRQEEPGEPRLPSLELRPAATARRFADGCRDGRHGRSGERMTGVILSRSRSGCLDYLMSCSSLFFSVGRTLAALAPLRIWLMLW